MSAALSRRVGQASYYPPLSELPPEERLLLHELSYRLHDLGKLPERFQRAILAAEANRLLAIEGERTAAEDPRVVVSTGRGVRRAAPAIGRRFTI